LGVLPWSSLRPCPFKTILISILVKQEREMVELKGKVRRRKRGKDSLIRTEKNLLLKCMIKDYF